MADDVTALVLVFLFCGLVVGFVIPTMLNRAGGNAFLFLANQLAALGAIVVSACLVIIVVRLLWLMI